ncbi:MAG: hypothetical protein IKU53_02245 [Firmicutes bacterium]|nr:hypothetical protein [Bacillota bacterium]
MYRSDGYSVRSNNPMYLLTPYIMDKRYDASNSITQDIELDPIQDFARKCRKEGVAMSSMAVIIAAYLRTAAKYPFLNRFCMNKRIYARNHFCVSFITLTPGKGNSTANKIYFNMDDDVYTVNEKINAAIEKCQHVDGDTALDDLMNKLVAIPGLVGFAVGMLKFVDKHFTLPLSILNASPFHTSLFITNLASIRIGTIYHHLYEFGTTGVFISMGQPVKKVYMEGDVAVEKKIMELGVVLDERIADGHYYGMAFKEFKKLCRNPELLAQKAEVVNWDPDIKKKNWKFIVK